MSEQAIAAPAAQSSAPQSESIESSETIESQAEGQESEAPAEEINPEAKAAEVKEIKNQLKKLKLKYNGKEEEVEFDPNDDEFMRKQFQMAKLGTQKAQDYAQLEKEVLAFVEELRKNPKKALANPNIGIDLKKFAAEILEEEITNSQKSPEQLEKEKLEARLRELEDERSKEKEDMRNRELERLQAEEYRRYDDQMSKALESAKLPKSPYLVKKMADYMLMGLQDGLKLEPQDVLPIVKEEMMSDLKEMFNVMPAEVIKEMIGKDTLEKIRKHNISNAKKAPVHANTTKDVGASKVSNSSPEAKKVNMKEFFGF